MSIAEIVAKLEGIDCERGVDDHALRQIDADIALEVFFTWKGATKEKTYLTDGDRQSRDMDAIGAGCIGWCILIRSQHGTSFVRVPHYTSDHNAAMSLWKKPPDMVPRHPISNCVAALKAAC